MAAHPRPVRLLTMLALLVSTGLLGGFGPASATRAAGSIECAPPATPGAGSATPAAPAPSAAPATAAPFPQNAGELTVFAAASLTDAFGVIKTDLESANPGLTITFNFAGSQALVTQLEQGASADVFASASRKTMDTAVGKGLIDGKPAAFAKNRLALIVPKDNPAGVATPADLARSGVKLVLAQTAVPVGQYAREAICKAGRESAVYGEGFAEKVAANIVSEEDNVKAVVAKIQTGEADAGIVYTTDVNPQVAADVTVIEIPADINVVATYPIAAVKGGKSALAHAFIEYVAGPKGQATLQSFGFEPTS